jgi:hypothetical protein
VAVTRALFELRLKKTVLVDTVAGSKASLKLIVTDGFLGTPVAPVGGLTATTVGGIVSGGSAVVNDDEKFVANALPAKSLTLGSVAPPSALTV